jgi:hypothetical protein
MWMPQFVYPGKPAVRMIDIQARNVMWMPQSQSDEPRDPSQP